MIRAFTETYHHDAPSFLRPEQLLCCTDRLLCAITCGYVKLGNSSLWSENASHCTPMKYLEENRNIPYSRCDFGLLKHLVCKSQDDLLLSNWEMWEVICLVTGSGAPAAELWCPLGPGDPREHGLQACGAQGMWGWTSHCTSTPTVLKDS